MAFQSANHHFPLYYDLICQTLELYYGNYGALCRYALVNKEFHRAASALLYRLVVLSPPASQLSLLNLRDTGAISSPSNLPSAMLSHYAPLVRELEISGCLSPRPPPRNTLQSVIREALSKFINLGSVKFVPNTCHEEVFLESLKLLPSITSLGEVAVNASCLDRQDKVDHLVQLTTLKELSLRSPGRVVLQALPEWLENLSHTLRELHLLDNCGSITPGVLKGLLPHIYTDIFEAIDQLRCLQRLRLRYYYQIKVPKYKPRLKNLKHFTAICIPTTRRAEAVKLCAWIRRIIAASPIESLSIVAEGDEDEDQAVMDACPAYDAIIHHLIHRHSETLRSLHIKNGLVTVRTLRGFFEACTSVEDLCISIDGSAMDVVEKQLPAMQRLHTLTFYVPKYSGRVAQGDVARIMKMSQHLKTLSTQSLRNASGEVFLEEKRRRG